MPRPEVFSVDESLIPEGSTAETAAAVRLANGTTTVIELFSSRDEKGVDWVDFRGLPAGLGLEIRIVRSLFDAIRSPDRGLSTASMQQENAYAALQKNTIVQYAIGARQDLWDGAEPVYSSEADDPRSPHYNFGD